jgi:RNA polymerase sigma factor (sigma-70 family)
MHSVANHIAVVDDDEAVRQSLSRLLRSAGYAVETFDSAQAFIAARPPSGFACAVLDVQMPGLTGLELQARLDAAVSAPEVIFLTGHGDIPMSVEAMKGGAIDFLTKPVDESRLLPAIEAALSRHAELAVERQQQCVLQECIDTLSVREREVLRCLLTGALNKQIADRLGITEKTVKVHRARVLHKMEVASLVELTRLCAILGVPPDPQLAGVNHRPQ